MSNVKKQRARSEEFKTPECRFAYVHHMLKRRPKKDPKTDKPVLNARGEEVTEQQCTLIFDKATTDRGAFDAMARKVILEEWGEKGVELAKSGMIKLPFIDGDSKQCRHKDTGQLHPGMGPDVWILRVSTQMEAAVRYKSQFTTPNYGTGDDEIKSGDYGFAVLQAFAWENAESGKGVSFGINFLQKRRSGEHIGAEGPDPEKTAATYYEAIGDTGGSIGLGSSSAANLFG